MTTAVEEKADVRAVELAEMADIRAALEVLKDVPVLPGNSWDCEGDTLVEKVQQFCAQNVTECWNVTEGGGLTTLDCAEIARFAYGRLKAHHGDVLPTPDVQPDFACGPKQLSGILAKLIDDLSSRGRAHAIADALLSFGEQEALEALEDGYQSAGCAEFRQDFDQAREAYDKTEREDAA